MGAVEKDAVVRRQNQMRLNGAGGGGSGGGVGQATCDASNSYLKVVVRLSPSRVDDISDGYNKLLPFIEDFVPSETRKYGCTK
ncbi:hypothetical protein ACWCPS_33645 [Streptomyces mauvecolor]